MYNAYLYDGNVSRTKLINAEFPKGTKIVQVEHGWNHYVALDSEGYIWGWGSNFYHQTGINYTRKMVETPTRTNIRGVTKIFTNSNSKTTFFITKDNKLYVIGLNGDGQAGLENKTPSRDRIFRHINEPREIKLPEIKEIKIPENEENEENNMIKKITGNMHASFILMTNGDVYSTGASLITGFKKISFEFKKILFGQKIIAIFCSASYCAFSTGYEIFMTLNCPLCYSNFPNDVRFEFFSDIILNLKVKNNVRKDCKKEGHFIRGLKEIIGRLKFEI